MVARQWLGILCVSAIPFTHGLMTADDLLTTGEDLE